MPETPDAHVAATEYEVSCLPAEHRERIHFTIKVSWRGPGDQWAVCDGFGSCLGFGGEWAYEPSPSNRTDEWKATHRFSLELALQVAREQAPHMTCNGWTVAEALAGRRNP